MAVHGSRSMCENHMAAWNTNESSCDDHTQLHGTLWLGPAHLYVSQLHSKAFSVCIIMILSRVLIESWCFHLWHWWKTEWNLQKFNNCRITILRKNVIGAFCLTDSPFDGCYNSKIASLSISPEVAKKALFVFFLLFCLFLVCIL